MMIVWYIYEFMIQFKNCKVQSFNIFDLIWTVLLSRLSGNVISVTQFWMLCVMKLKFNVNFLQSLVLSCFDLKMFESFKFSRTLLYLIWIIKKYQTTIKEILALAQSKWMLDIKKGSKSHLELFDCFFVQMRSVLYTRHEEGGLKTDKDSNLQQPYIQ